MPQPSQPLSRIYAWFSAVANDDTALLDDLLAHGMPVNALHPLRHTTALMEATRLGRAGLVQWLLEHEAAPSVLCGLPVGTALHCALRRQQWDIAHILAHAMGDCALMDANGSSPLHTLCTEAYHNHQPAILLGLATLFIHKQCPLNSLDLEGSTALHHCVINGHLPLVSLLLRHGANPNALIPDSQVSPLAIAALEKNLIIAKLLLQFGADPHSRTHEGSSPVSIYPAIAPLVTEGLSVRGEGTHGVDVLFN